jgi:hypothetical protein
MSKQIRDTATPLTDNDATVDRLRQRLRAGTAITERRIEAAGIDTAVLECGEGVERRRIVPRHPDAGQVVKVRQSAFHHTGLIGISAPGLGRRSPRPARLGAVTADVIGDDPRCHRSPGQSNFRKYTADSS